MKRGLTKNDHARLRKEGSRIKAGPVLLSYFKEGEDLIYGFTISAKNGNAVTRNRIRRRLDAALREAFDGRELNLKLVMIPLDSEAILNKPYAELVNELATALGKVH